jgi:hypothetical protein
LEEGGAGIRTSRQIYQSSISEILPRIKAKDGWVGVEFWEEVERGKHTTPRTSKSMEGVWVRKSRACLPSEEGCNISKMLILCASRLRPVGNSRTFPQLLGLFHSCWNFSTAARTFPQLLFDAVVLPEVDLVNA